jgi:hypothetical protein
MYLFRNEEVRDHGKRAILRFFFIQVDNLLKLIGRLKNRLVAEGSLKGESKRELEDAITALRVTYDNAFDVIRDKFAAHAQLLDLGRAVGWWATIDYSTIEVLYGEVKAVEAALRAAKSMDFVPIGADYRPLTIPPENALSPDAQKFHFDAGRFGLTSPGALGVVFNAPVQEKAQLVVSTLDMLRFDFALTCLVEHYETRYKAYLFDVGWLLAAVDACSLIDTLFEHSANDGPSLLDQWGADGFGGHAALEALNADRDVAFETDLRVLRNKIAAHLDADTAFNELHKDFVDFDLRKLVEYVHRLANGFLYACRHDIRTKMFAAHGMPLEGVLGLAHEPRSFDDG